MTESKLPVLGVNIMTNSLRKAKQVNRKLARMVKDKNFTGEKSHENYRAVVPAPDDTNDDKILKAVLKKPNALFFTNDNNLFTKVKLKFFNWTHFVKLSFRRIYKVLKSVVQMSMKCLKRFCSTTKKVTLYIAGWK